MTDYNEVIQICLSLGNMHCKKRMKVTCTATNRQRQMQEKEKT